VSYREAHDTILPPSMFMCRKLSDKGMCRPGVSGTPLCCRSYRSIEQRTGHCLDCPYTGRINASTEVIFARYVSRRHKRCAAFSPPAHRHTESRETPSSSHAQQPKSQTEHGSNYWSRAMPRELPTAKFRHRALPVCKKGAARPGRIIIIDLSLGRQEPKHHIIRRAHVSPTVPTPALSRATPHNSQATSVANWEIYDCPQKPFARSPRGSPLGLPSPSGGVPHFASPGSSSHRRRPGRSAVEP